MERGEGSVYEENFAKLIHAQYAVAFSYARTGLCSILSNLGVGPGDEVLLSPLTCKVVPLSLLSLGITPKYVDISEQTLNLDPLLLAKHLSPRVKAILFQYTYGNHAGIEATAEFLKGSDIYLIEDCAQCTPTSYNGVMPGSYGIAAIFSQNLLKPIPAGSGGMATTNDAELGRKMQRQRDAMGSPGLLGNMSLRMEVFLHNHILRPEWYWWLFGLSQRVSGSYQDEPLQQEILCQVTKVGMRLSAYQCQLGMRGLTKLPQLTAHRVLCCREYVEGLRDCENVTLPIQATDLPFYYFPIFVRDKDALLARAKEHRIELIPWPIKMPIYPVTKKQAMPAYGYEWGTCPVAEEVATRLIGLPTHSKILPQHRQQILDLVATA